MSLQPGESVPIPKSRCGRCPRVLKGKELQGEVAGSAHHAGQYTVEVACEWVRRLGGRVLCARERGPETCTVNGQKRIPHGDDTVDVLVKEPQAEDPSGWRW